jgi:tetratricopeptide (TPR) repeat protein
MSEYRRGRFTNAIEWMSHVLNAPAGRGDRAIQALMVLAMAHCQLKQTEKACSAFAEGARIARVNLPKLESGDIGGWLNWMITHALIGEAQQMLIETIRDAPKVITESSADEQHAVVAAFQEITSIFMGQNKVAEAEKMFAELLPPKAPEQPLTPALLGARGEFRARCGRFAEAAIDFRKAKEANPAEHGWWHELAPLLVVTGQAHAYREHCRASLERFSDTSDPVVAQRIAKGCLILPHSGVDLKVVFRMTDAAVVATNHWSAPWFQFAKALAEYRQGRYPAVLEWANKVLAEAGKELERDVLAYAVLAMSHQHLHQSIEARDALTKAQETKLPTLENGDLGGNWSDWIIAQTLMREARALIKGDSVSSAAVDD